MRGYRRALEEHGLAYDERWVGAEMVDVLGVFLDELDQPKKNYAVFLDWMHESGPTAVVAANNYLAERANAVLTKIQMALMQAVIDAHVQDVDYQIKISLASITHRLLTLDLTPLVALAWQSGEELGEKAMELLVERINRDAPAPPRIVRIPMRIRVLMPEPQ